MSQRFRKEGNARINKVSPMRPGLAKIIEKVHTSRYFESSETDLHIAPNACSIDYADTWLPKRVHWLSKSQSPHYSSLDDGCEDTFELNTGVARSHLLFTEIHTPVAPRSRTQWLPATFRNSRWMDHCKVCQGTIEDISILDPVAMEEAYSPIAPRHRGIKWHVRSHGWRDASFGWQEDTMEGRLVLRCEVDQTEVVQLLCWSNSINGHASQFCKYTRSFPEVVII